MKARGASDFRFRTVTEADLPMLGGWFDQPHVSRWWGNENGQALAEIREAMASPSTEPMIVELGERPIGYIQSYDPHMECGHPYRDQPVGTLGFDQFIGIAELTGKGIGTSMVAALAEAKLGAGAPRILVDPDPANAVAIRAYGKAGFTAFDERTTVYGPVMMMKRDAR